MKTLIDINETMLKEAMKIAGTHTKKDTVNIALVELVKAGLRHKLKEMAGSEAVEISHTELKKLRHKRDKLHENLTSKN
jgi:Arc/MetJ family transcription regulator